MRLYHFTTVLHLPSIMCDGLNRGDVPLSPYKFKNAVWFTTEPDAGQGSDHGLMGIVDKRAVRITVDIDPKNNRLERWDIAAKRLNIGVGWLKVLDMTGGGQSRTWWLYWGAIPVNDFFSVEQRNKDGKYE